MRFTKKELHPSIFEAVNAWQAKLAHSLSVGGTTSDYAVYSSHQKSWWREYGLGFSVWSLLWAAMIIGLPIMVGQFVGRPLGVAMLFLALAGATAHGIVAYYRNKGMVTTDELRALLPALELTELQRDYCEAFLEVVQSKAMAGLEREEVLAQLHTLMDEATRLEAQRTSLAETLGDSGIRAKLDEEVRQMELKMNAATDPIARETYASSLEIARKRASRFQDGAPIVERIEAQIALIEQTMAAFREVLLRLRQTPSTPDHDLSALRKRVTEIQTQGTSLESAYDELNAFV